MWNWECVSGVTIDLLTQDSVSLIKFWAYMCATRCACVCVCTSCQGPGDGACWSEERGESSKLGSLSKSLVTGAQTRPQLAPLPTILAFLPLSGTQRVNSNSLLMNWLLKVTRQAAYLLNTHTHWQQSTVKKVCCTLSTFHCSAGCSLTYTCGGSLNSSWFRGCVQDHPEESCVLAFKTI